MKPTPIAARMRLPPLPTAIQIESARMNKNIAVINRHSARTRLRRSSRNFFIADPPARFFAI